MKGDFAGRFISGGKYVTSRETRAPGAEGGDERDRRPSAVSLYALFSCLTNVSFYAGSGRCLFQARQKGVSSKGLLEAEMWVTFGQPGSGVVGANWLHPLVM